MNLNRFENRNLREKEDLRVKSKLETYWKIYGCKLWVVTGRDLGYKEFNFLCGCLGSPSKMGVIQ